MLQRPANSQWLQLSIALANRLLQLGTLGNDQQSAVVLIRPSRPVENGFIESFDGRLRDEFLNVQWFALLEDARQKLARFRQHYNHHRPHSALADKAPAGFAELHRLKKQNTDTLLRRIPEPLDRVLDPPNPH